ncbi:MAG: ATP-binding cassette domain-containing protein [Gemmataceae bacterium]|nr:ATP-binding cassette domain-containing protein [Gemmataceae bacterium]MCI0740289.1 ATP-binding cassette domain-containing protein [Gemmataceae bacterium]
MTQLFCDIRFRRNNGFAIEARFEVGAGVTALFGPSGSGKTTLLHLLAGLLRPDRGVIHLDGRTFADDKKGVFLAPETRNLGVVFQDLLLFPHLSVRKNLNFGVGRRGARSIDFRRLVDLLDLGDLLERLPGTLSGGQQQRVALGRALLRGPGLLLLDEPLASLDAELKNRILDYLERALAEWRIPTLFVSHDWADVRLLAQEVLVIEKGKSTGDVPSRVVKQ